VINLKEVEAKEISTGKGPSKDDGEETTALVTQIQKCEGWNKRQNEKGYCMIMISSQLGQSDCIFKA